MLLQPRLSNKALAELCHRLAVETDAGIDIRRTWQRESESARGILRPRLQRVAEGLGRGDSLSESLVRAGPIFPRLFLELVHVGEETGTLGRVLSRLERHFRRLVEAQRAFLTAIAWPVIELGLAVLIIGVLILVMGIIGQRAGRPPADVLGFGLTGVGGFILYMAIVMTAVLAGVGMYAAVRRGVFWARPLQRGLMYVPVLGDCLQKLSLARMAWALHLTLNVAMDLRRIAPLALRSTGNDYYIRHTDAVTAAVSGGRPLSQALAQTGAFPSSFVDTMSVGEESGQIVESMQRLADQYEAESESAIKVLATLFGVAVFLLVAAMITWLIFQLFASYAGTINNALEGKF